MNNTLKVVKDFFVLEPNDMLELNEDGNYVNKFVENFDMTDEEGTVTSYYEQSYTITPEFAKRLIKDGYLVEQKPKKKFTNVFDEIDSLLSKYNQELTNAESKEQKTVLANMCKLLDHLKTLKK